MSVMSSLVRGALPVVEKMAAFTEARHRVLTENIANIDTPGYRMRQLDPAGFQAELRRAADARQCPGETLRLRDTGEISTDACGQLHVTPGLEPVENLTFQDGTNARAERQMALLAENAMAHQLSMELLRGQYGSLIGAIRGRVQ